MERHLLVLDYDEFVGTFIKRATESFGLAARVTQTVEAFAAELAA